MVRQLIGQIESCGLGAGHFGKEHESSFLLVTVTMWPQLISDTNLWQMNLSSLKCSPR